MKSVTYKNCPDGSISRNSSALLVDVGALAVWKYADFGSRQVNSLVHAFGGHGSHVLHFVLPIGISFFTFHHLSYVVDVYRKDAVAQKSPVHAALYLLLFPQLIAGPIIRYRDIADQLARRVVRIDDMTGTNWTTLGTLGPGVKEFTEATGLWLH